MVSLVISEKVSAKVSSSARLFWDSYQGFRCVLKALSRAVLAGAMHGHEEYAVDTNCIRV